MKGADTYYYFRQSVEELEFLASSVPLFLEFQNKVILKHGAGPEHPLYKGKKLMDVYLDKDYEGLMAKQLLFTLFARFETNLDELLMIFLHNDQEEFKKLKKERSKRIINQLNLLYKFVPLELKNEIDVNIFYDIDYYYVIRNLFIHNNGIINIEAVDRANRHLTKEDIGMKIRIDIEEFNKIFELLSDISCKFSDVIDKIKPLEPEVREI